MHVACLQWGEIFTLSASCIFSTFSGTVLIKCLPQMSHVLWLRYVSSADNHELIIIMVFPGLVSMLSLVQQLCAHIFLTISSGNFIPIVFLDLHLLIFPSSLCSIDVYPLSYMDCKYFWQTVNYLFMVCLPYGSNFLIFFFCSKISDFAFIVSEFHDFLAKIAY